LSFHDEGGITFGERFQPSPSSIPFRIPTEKEKFEIARQRWAEKDRLEAEAAAAVAAARGGYRDPQVPFPKGYAGPSEQQAPQPRTSPHFYGPNLDPSSRRELKIAEGPVVPQRATKPLTTSPSQSRYYGINGGISRREGTFRVHVEYVNFTDKTIYVQTPTNVTMAITPTTSVVNPYESRPCLEIRTSYELLTPTAILETFEMLRSFVVNQVPFDADNGALWDALEKHYQNDSRTGSQTNFRLIIVHRVLEDAMVNQERTLLRDSNYYVTFHKEHLAKPHADSQIGMKSPEKFSPAFQDHAGVMITVVDNHQLHRLRYYYAGKQIVAVPSQLDPTRENGVYVLSASANPYGTVNKHVAFMSFKEAEERLGLYASRSEAETHGNPELLSKAAEAQARAALEQQKQELEQQKLELERTRHHLETKTIEKKSTQVDSQADLEYWKMRNAELKEMLDLQRAMRDEELNERKTRRDDYFTERDLQRKDKFDKKSTKRKGFLEKIKFGQVVLGTIAGAFAMLAGKKLFGSMAAA